MSRGYRFAVAATLWIFAVAIHYVGVEMFAPSGAMWDLAQPAIDNGWVGASWRDQMYKTFAQFVPLLVMGFSLIWLFVSEYEAQTTTTRRRVRR